MTTRLFKTIGDVLEANGYTRKGRTWYAPSEETIRVVSVIKSRWGNAYFVGLGIWMKQLGHTAWPRENKCHLRTRLEVVAGKKVENALNLERDMQEDERANVIERALTKCAIPFLAKCSSVSGIRILAKTGKLEDALMHRDLSTLLYGL